MGLRAGVTQASFGPRLAQAASPANLGLVAIDLNADVGEGAGDDAALLALVTSANVACGFHAGDALTMQRTVEAAARSGVAVGAHPGYADRAGFGREPRAIPAEQVFAEVLYQVGALQALCRPLGVRLAHVKPHGALYNQAARDEVLALAIARAVAAASGDLVLVGLAASAPLQRAAAAAGLRFAAEAFADRRYAEDGTLVPRSEPGSVLTDPAAVAAQALAIARAGRADTLCLHGDTPGALDNARAVRAALRAAGFQVRALPR